MIKKDYDEFEEIIKDDYMNDFSNQLEELFSDFFKKEYREKMMKIIEMKMKFYIELNQN